MASGSGEMKAQERGGSDRDVNRIDAEGRLDWIVDGDGEVIVG